MTFIIGLLTFVLVLLCVALIFLVLIQLPKKEAGIGVAFGGGATDALFGAGSGNVLTKATKYAAIGFFVLAILVGMLQSKSSPKNQASSFQEAVQQQQMQQPPVTGTPANTPPPGNAPTAPAPAPAPAPSPAPAPAPAPAQK
jgi:preprotein translocase subunit SecG